MSAQNEHISELLPVRQWRATHGGNIFPTDSSLEWFLRRHRQRLVQSGAYLPRRGRAGALVHAPTINRLVPALLRAEAASLQA